MPRVGSIEFPYTEAGRRNATFFENLLQRAAQRGALRSFPRIEAGRAQGPLTRGTPYARGISQMRQSPVGFRPPVANPGIGATLPIEEGLELALSGYPDLASLFRGERPQPRGMATLRGTF